MQRQIHIPGRVLARAALLLVLLAPGLSACKGAQATITITATPRADERAGAPVGTSAAGLQAPAGAGAPARLNPFTGLPVSDPALFERRPLAVKISNAPDSVRPQAGIASADLVFEHYVEGDLTRFTAIFWSSTPPRVGSIRSARLIDLELVAMYDALFVYSGASEPIRQRIAALPNASSTYEGVSVGEPLYYRDPASTMPHNLFAVPAEVWARAAADGLAADQDTPPDTGLIFDAHPPADAAAVRRVTIDYGPDVVRWTYDADTGRYSRAEDGEPHTDALTGEPITAANVVLIYAHHQPDYSIVESEWQGEKSYSTEIQIWTLGPAVIFRDGSQVRGYWHRWEEDAPLTLWANEDGTEPLALAPGSTWFEVVPLDFTGVIVE